MKLIMWMLVCAACCSPMLAPAASESSELAALDVTDQRGPPIWRVARDDHELWIVGSWAPVPMDLKWNTRPVELLGKQADEVLGNTSLRAEFAGGGLRKTFAGLRLLASVRGLRNLPDDGKLSTLLPPELQARVDAQLDLMGKKRPKGTDRWRPMFLADTLYNHALATRGLVQSNVASAKLMATAQGAGVRVSNVGLRIEMDKPQELVAAFRQLPLQPEIQCLAQTLDMIEHDLPNAAQRAGSWAIGLKDDANSHYAPASREPCLVQAVRAAPPGSKLHQMVDGMTGRVQDRWSDMASYALLKNATTVAAVPVPTLLRPDGLLARLRASGYVIEEPRGWSSSGN